MKVVLFCGGQGMRIREHAGDIPKPMVPVGGLPILCHLMEYYAHFGHKDFVLCLGHGSDYIRDYFRQSSHLPTSDTQDEFTVGDLHIHCIDTGLTASVGERLHAIREVVDQETFLANYADGLSDVELPRVIEHHRKHAAIGTCLCVKPTQSFHLVSNQSGLATDIVPVSEIPQWMNGGFFVFEPEIFDFLRPGEDLAAQPFQRLIAAQRLACYNYTGFWGCMDTYKEKKVLDDMHASGIRPWEVWTSTESDLGYDARNRIIKTAMGRLT
ncbi:MAG TPA: glucose-1-phosphate cytidylyltransferase [Planctomycetaceae bacterium]|nr:glucose-1-phosphate cytidylyltransferase [Planctomycetaceae bacterium]